MPHDAWPAGLRGRPGFVQGVEAWVVTQVARSMSRPAAIHALVVAQEANGLADDLVLTVADHHRLMLTKAVSGEASSKPPLMAA